MKWLLITLLMVASTVWGVEGQKSATPWYAGNIISNYGINFAPGSSFFEVYFLANRIYGIYNKRGEIRTHLNIHQYTSVLEWGTGLTDAIDLTVEASGVYIVNDGHETTQFGDAEVFLGFQVLKGKKNKWPPYVRFLIGEIFPTGKYTGLDPRFSGGDAVGFGAFNTFVSLIIQKFYEGKHTFNWTLNLYYYLPSRVRVKGANTYLNAVDVNGKIRPGVEFAADFAIEYKFNKPWGFGLDIFFEQQNSSSFYNNRADFDLLLPSFLPSSFLLSLAPSIEYNFNDKFGMLAGSWFTVSGRNVPAFTSLVYAVYWEF